MKKFLIILAALILILVIIYLLGPSPDTPVYSKEMPVLPSDPGLLERYIADKEASHKLRPDNEARIIWNNDSARQKTPYSIVYLHGFTASQAEGDPIHRNIAKQFGCNLFLSRLAEHGIDTTEPMALLTADRYWESAKEALAIGKQLGNKVILMGTSTGGTNALQLAANYPNDVAALVLMSPNIEINDPSAWILNNPWGYQMAKQITGSGYLGTEEKSAKIKQYWTAPYRLEAAVALQELVETTMNEETFEKIQQPTLLLYYYKDEIHQDSTVKVSAMQTMFSKIATPPAKKRAVAVPKAGNHVIGSYLRSADVEGVQKQIELFMNEILGLTPTQNQAAQD